MALIHTWTVFQTSSTGTKFSGDVTREWKAAKGCPTHSYTEEGLQWDLVPQSPQRISDCSPLHSSTNVCQDGSSGQAHIHSEGALFVTSDSWSLALNTTGFQKIQSAAKTRRAAHEKTQFTEKVSRDIYCVSLNASLKITHKTPGTTLAANSVLPFTTTSICAHNNTWTDSYHSTRVSHTFNPSWLFRRFFSFCKLSHWLFPSPLE